MDKNYQPGSISEGQYKIENLSSIQTDTQFQSIVSGGVDNSNTLVNFQYDGLNNIVGSLGQEDESAAAFPSESSFDVTSHSEKDEKSSKSEKKTEDDAEKVEMNNRSVFVNNVEYKAIPEELKEHFKNCGDILRVTIIWNKKTGKSMGHAYVEFEKEESVDKAIELYHDSLFKGRQIKVLKKRLNVPGKKKHAKKFSKGNMYGYMPPRGMGPMIPISFPMHMPYMPYHPVRGMMPRGRGKW